MTLSALRDDALTSTPEGWALRLALPWIRSLPLSSLRDVRVAIDDAPVAEVRVALSERSIEPDALERERVWWFVQDRIVLRSDRMLDAGVHAVTVSFELLIPYLPAGPDAPLVLPFRVERDLELDAPAPVRSVSRDVA